MKRYLPLLAVLVVGIGGCDRTIESKDPVRSVPEATPVPYDVEVFINTETVDLQWKVSDSSNIARYRIYVADIEPVDFRIHDSSSNTSATLSNLVINRLYYFKIASVSREGIEGESSIALPLTLGRSSITINSDAEFTNSRSVRIQVNTSATAAQVILSEEADFSGSEFVAFAPERTYTLSEGDGAKTVYARLVYADGSESSEVLSDDIILDTRAEISSVFYAPTGSVFSAGQTITFGLDAGELSGRATVSFTGVSGLRLYDDGTDGDDTADDGVYHGQYVVPVGSNLFEAVVTGNFTDAAGNSAVAVRGEQLLSINTPPDAVEIVLVAGVDSVRFQWTRSEEDDFASYQIYSAANSSVDLADTRVAIINAVEPPSPWYAVAAPAVNTYYRVYVFDQHGASTGSNVVLFEP
ncbi:MAG: fibronectin type III domain-containing protein [Candidatus Zixiibacteriota bacterium]